MSSHWETHNLIAIPVRHDGPGWKPAMYNQRKRPVRNSDGAPSIIFTQPRTGNPAPPPQRQSPLPPQGKNNHCGGKQVTSVDFAFVAHVGSVNKEGVACTRKAKTEKKGYSVDSFSACSVIVSLKQWLTVAAGLSDTSTRPATMSMHESCKTGAQSQQSVRRSRAPEEGTCLLLVVIEPLILTTETSLPYTDALRGYPRPGRSKKLTNARGSRGE